MTEERICELVEAAQPRLADYRRLREAGLIPKDGDFFPSVHYPPITMYQPITEEQLFETYTLPADGLVDVYVHIPFCKKRCIYCHYPSLYGTTDANKDRYLTALEREMDLYLRRLGVDKFKPRAILAGGGTPTDLTPAQLERFLLALTSRLDGSHLQQFSYDVDPSTLVGEHGLERLRLLRAYGVDRLTIGVQSFNDKILKHMNRAHDARVALESIENSVRLGFKINLELIYGYPEQTFANWLEVLETAIRTDVNEIQLYRLKVIPYGDQEGVITKVRRIRPSDIPVAHDTLLMKQLGILLLAENGYAENLCRVFTKHRSDISLYAYNQCCLLYDQIGLGLTGFSSLRDRFGLNTQYFEDYYKAIEDQRLPLSRGLIRNREQQMRWAIVLPLKNYYIRKPHFTPGTQAPVPSFLQDRFASLKTFGLLFEDERKIALTPLGSFFADEVMTLFYEPMHIPFPESAYEAGPLNPYGLTSRMESSQTGQLHASAGVRTRTSAAAHQ